jgi:hypothetical protein
MSKPQLIRALTEHYNRYILNANDQRIPTRFELDTLETLRRYASIAGIMNRTSMSRNHLIRILREEYPYMNNLPPLPPVRSNNRNNRNVTTREPRTNRGRRTASSSLPSFVAPSTTPLQRTPQINDQQQQQRHIQIQQIPSQQQQWWKTRCNNDDGTLQSQQWKDVSKENVIQFSGYCFTLPEIYGMIHRAFTSTDTSYGIPPLRLQIPSEPFGRIPFTLDFFLQLRKKIKENKIETIPTFPDVLYFLRFVRKFYAPDGPIHRFLSMRDPSKVEVSRAIENFLTKTPVGNPGLEMHRRGERANTEISWTFKDPQERRMTDSQKFHYVKGRSP